MLSETKATASEVDDMVYTALSDTGVNVFANLLVVKFLRPIRVYLKLRSRVLVVMRCHMNMFQN